MRREDCCSASPIRYWEYVHPPPTRVPLSHTNLRQKKKHSARVAKTAKWVCLTCVKLMVKMAWLRLLLSCMWVTAVVLRSQGQTTSNKIVRVCCLTHLTPDTCGHVSHWEYRYVWFTWNLLLAVARQFYL